MVVEVGMAGLRSGWLAFAVTSNTHIITNGYPMINRVPVGIIWVVSLPHGAIMSTWYPMAHAGIISLAWRPPMSEGSGAGLMARPKQRADNAPEDRRVAAIVLKDTVEYRDWLTGLSEATLIPVTTIVRDALAKWAADKGLPGPPAGASKSQRRVGDRAGGPKRPKQGKSRGGPK
jgi:hypothetical protein